VGISVDEEIVDQITKIVNSGKYRNRSHFFEVAAKKLLEEENHENRN